MMNSDHLQHESDSLHESGLHHRETVSINVHNDGADDGQHQQQQYQHNPSNGNGNNGGSENIPNNTPRKRRSMNFWDRTSDSGHVRLDVDDKYAKYGKKRKKKQNVVFFGTICVVSFMLGFAWMHFTRGPSSSSPQPRLQLRHALRDTIQQWKPHNTPPTNPDKQQKLNDKQQPTNNKHSLLIPRFDTRKYVNSWEKNARNAALQQIGQTHPKSITLEGWNYPIAFRSFPYARQTHGPIKNLDSDYGGLTYHSIKNEETFARVIPEDEEDDIVPGGFDPDSIYTEPESLEERNRKRKRHPESSYPNLNSDGRKRLHRDANFEELRNYYDDDNVHVLPKANDGKTKDPRACQKAEVSHLYFPTCNNFHEHDLGRVFDDPEDIVHPRPENEMYRKYLAHGYYRDVWIMEDNPSIWPSRYPKEKDQKQQKYGVLDEERTSEMVAKAYRSTALKTLQMKHPYSDEHFEEVQLEAIIMERLTKSPRIMNIYGHCVFSTMVEVIPIEFEEVAVPGEGYFSQEEIDKRNKKGVRPYNDFTPTEKLGFALDMAESIADLHGFEDGVIVHDDVQPCQWLRTPDGRLKLGDFNRATIMQWDVVNGEYCKFNNGAAFANYRAPEEFAVRNLNEQIDTFSFGNNLYGMLTGLWNFYDTDDDEVVQKKIIDGKKPYVDSRYSERSFGERKLVELMKKCWIYDPDKRISIFDAVDFLKKAIKENEAQSGGN